MALDPSQSSAQQAYAELKTGALLVPLTSHTPIRVTGADRLEFLHGQVSNDVKGLAVGQFNASLMLNHKGHALAQLKTFRREDDVFLSVEGTKGAFVLSELERHIIFDQVELGDLSGTIQKANLQGVEATNVVKKVFGDVPTTNQFLQVPFKDAKILICSSKRSKWTGFDMHVLSKDAEDLYDTFREAGAAVANEAALEIARVEAGIAAAETEGGEGVLPQEAGLEHAVSYRKGCYLGQEIMARIEARGNVRRELVGLKLAEPPNTETKDLLVEGKKVGRLGKVVEHPRLGVIALAVLRKGVEQVETTTGLTAQRVDLPFTTS